MKTLKAYWPDIKQAIGSAYSLRTIKRAGLTLFWIGFILIVYLLVK